MVSDWPARKRAATIQPPAPLRSTENQLPYSSAQRAGRGMMVRSADRGLAGSEQPCTRREQTCMLLFPTPPEKLIRIRPGM